MHNNQQNYYLLIFIRYFNFIKNLNTLTFIYVFDHHSLVSPFPYKNPLLIHFINEIQKQVHCFRNHLQSINRQHFRIRGNLHDRTQNPTPRPPGPTRILPNIILSKTPQIRPQIKPLYPKSKSPILQRTQVFPLNPLKPKVNQNSTQNNPMHWNNQKIRRASFPKPSQAATIKNRLKLKFE